MDQDLKATLSRIAEALDRLAPPAPPSADINRAEAHVWHAAGHRLGTVLKGNRGAAAGSEGGPEKWFFHPRRSRRHVMPRDMMEKGPSTAINPSEAVEEKVSLSDRFGLWLGFHNADQDTFFAMIEAYAKHYKLDVPVETLRKQAVEWSVTRGARSGRVAWQLIQEVACPLQPACGSTET